MDKVAILIDALRRIASYGSENVNRTWIRAFHTPLILIAQEALEKVVICDAVQSLRTKHLHLERHGSFACRS
jgi:hypothetical protein